MPLPDFDVLVAIADTGSLTAAAHRLGLPRPTLSRRLTKLEEDMRTRLVNRTTRRTTLTEAGQELYRHARPIVAAVEAANDAVQARDGVPRGLLRVSVPNGGMLIANMLAGFAVAYPDVQMEVVTAARHVDLVGEGFDIALRGGQLRAQSLVTRQLRSSRVIGVASPEYLAQHGTPIAASDLAHHRCLVGFTAGEYPHRSWPLLNGDTTPVVSVLAANDPQVLLAAALRSVGIALLPDQFAKAALERGALVPVLAGVLGVRTGLWLVYPEKRLMLPRVRAFIDHVVAWISQHPEPLVSEP